MSTTHHDSPPAGRALRSATAPEDVRRGPRSPVVLVILAVLASLVCAGFVALGTWQVYRRAWKLDLIERVEQRVHAAPAAAPGPAQWPAINAADDEYRRVRLTGTYVHDAETFVQAATDLGSGFWVLTPLRQADGTVVLVNRGFVTSPQRDRAARDSAEPEGEVSVSGLLRVTQPNGGFLKKNDAAADRWFSRDVQAIAAKRGLDRTAPYFVDADAAPPRADGTPAIPVGGLTIVTFHNSHLVYALTWYGLALMVAGGAWYVGREERRLRRSQERNTLRANGEREDAPAHQDPAA